MSDTNTIALTIKRDDLRKILGALLRAAEETSSPEWQTDWQSIHDDIVKQYFVAADRGEGALWDSVAYWME